MSLFFFYWFCHRRLVSKQDAIDLVLIPMGIGKVLTFIVVVFVTTCCASVAPVVVTVWKGRYFQINT